MIPIRALFTRTTGRSHVFRTYYQPRTHGILQLSRRLRSYHTATSEIYGNLDHSKNEIRVIKIEPGRWDDELSCRLQVVSLDRLLRPRYDTLSYTWGSSRNTITISVNKQAVGVSSSLFTALRALRRTFKTVTIWADALCINQNNNSEKSKQVALMGRIYKQGRQTWVSLGCPDEEWADGSWSPAAHLSENARVLQRLVRGLWRLLWHHLVLRRSRRSRLGVNHISDARRLMSSAENDDHLDDSGRENRRAATSMLTWLATHEYWSRVWVVQEIALSRTDPICIFGKHQVPLLSLDTVFSDWAAGADVISPASRRVSWSPEVGEGVNRAQEICMLRDEFLSVWTLRLTGSMGLLRALQFASYRRASIAHDHVYGLRSLLPASEQDSLPPDYNLSVRQLYASVTRLLLGKANSVSLLCVAVGTSQHNEHNLPSWSLDFSKPLRLPVLGAGIKECEDLSGDDSRDCSILRLQGRSLGEHIIAYAPREYVFDGLTHNLELSNFRTKSIYDEDTYRRGWSSDIGIDPHVEQPPRPAKDASEPRIAAGQKYVLFITDQGRLGKCPNEVQKDDEIWTLAGSKTAFVLRPIPGEEEGHNRYRLVGPCDFLTDTGDSSGYVNEAIEIV